MFANEKQASKTSLTQLPLIQIFKSRYCVATFILAFFFITLISPKKIFHGHNTFIGLLFILSTSLLITCLVRSIKEKIYSARLNGASVLGVISIVLGLGAIEACAVSAPVCGAYLGSGILAIFFPNIILNVFEKYNTLIILFSFLFQILALYQLKCFCNKSKKCAH